MATPVALAMIVKDEAEHIQETLESARKALGKGPTVIHDTGSTDDTIQKVCDWANEAGQAASTFIFETVFVDFSTARNACLASAFKYAPVVCMVDAGVVVSGALKGKARTRPGTVTCKLGAIEYTRPQIFTPGWAYTGRVHEYASGPGEAKPSGLTFAYPHDDTKRVKRWERDLGLLVNDYGPRGRFYYAQTLDCLGRYAEAFSAYMIRADMGDFEAERLQALVNAVRTAPTMALARYVACLGQNCADVQCEAAMREDRAGVDRSLAKTFASQALACKTRSMFARVDLREVCERILEK